MAVDMLPVIVVMGVSGCGKSTIASLLAARLGRVYLDADDLHSPAAIAKMASGMPLTDDDRGPWLERVGARIAEGEESGFRTVVACSALRRRYRDTIRTQAGVPVFFVHLTGANELLAERMRARTGHYMPASLLASQLTTLEPLQEDEAGTALDIAAADDIAAAALRAIESVRT
ncbi:gluconokinase [Microbacterium aurantiacum]|uniref:gluconokinase n=1 Tax=Microbacterium aurantiacum TaxID=162393 RepID=UPI003F490ED7